MKTAVSPLGVRTFCVIFGTVETLLAVLWCLAGAGIYGSPLGGMRGPELAYLWAIVLTGPFSALPAAIVFLRRPRWGAIWLIVGAIVSGILALTSLTTDSHVAPIPGVFAVPMLIVGLWLFRQTVHRNGFRPGAEHPIEPRAQQQHTRGEMRSIAVGVVLFLVTWVGTYATFIALVISNVTGLRGPPRSDNPFVCENADRADSVVLLLVFIAVGLISLARKRLHLRVEFVAGMWVALALGGLVLALR